MARNKNRRSEQFRKKMRNKKASRTERTAMLDMGKLTIFKYDLKEIVNNSDLEEEAERAFMANLIAKARNRGIDEARAYIRSFQESGDITDETAEQIFRLLKRHTRYR